MKTLFINGHEVSNNDEVVEFRKVSYWRGFWVGIFIGLIPATFFFVLLQKLINVSL